MQDEVLQKSDFYQPGPVESEHPLSIEVLSNAVSTAPDNTKLGFALACLLLRAGRYEEAEQQLALIEQLEPQFAEASVNRAVALAKLGRTDAASQVLRTVVLARPDLMLAHIHLARLEHRAGNIDAAIVNYERALRVENRIETVHELGQVYIDAGLSDKARSVFQRAFSLDSQSVPAQRFLGREAFFEARAVLLSGNFDRAQMLFADAYKQYPAVFSSDREVAQSLAELQRADEIEQEYEQLQARFSAGERTPLICYQLALRLLFRNSVLPELYVDRERLEEIEAHWAREATEEDHHFPYARYRQALCQLMRGEIDSAVEMLTACRDAMPSSKRRPLRIDAILAAVRDLRALARDRVVSAAADEEPSRWEAVGLADPFQQQAWRRAGFAAADAGAWKQQGFTANQAAQWAAVDFAAAEAHAWVANGFSEPRQARLWQRGGVSAEVAGVWMKSFPGDAERALQAVQAGFPDSEIAVGWLKLFMFPWDAIRWFNLGFTTKEAAIYLAEGTRDPDEAKRQALEKQRLETEKGR